MLTFYYMHFPTQWATYMVIKCTQFGYVNCVHYFLTDNMFNVKQVENYPSHNASVFFNGKIPEAISVTKSEQKILIVYIAGTYDGFSLPKTVIH